MLESLHSLFTEAAWEANPQDLPSVKKDYQTSCYNPALVTCSLVSVITRFSYIDPHQHAEQTSHVLSGTIQTSMISDQLILDDP